MFAPLFVTESWTALATVLDFATLNWPHFDHYIWPHPNR